MVTQTTTLEDIRGRSLEKVLQDVAKSYKNLVVRLPDGREIAIEPRLQLKPLPVLEGHVPKGWKDAIHTDG